MNPVGILQAIGPHRGRGDFGHGTDGFRRGFMSGDGIPGGRKLGSSELQLVLRAFLAEQPAHGYELIRILGERSGGFYTPSPGMVYPADTFIEEIGHAAVTQEGNRKLYTLTAAGRAHLDANREHVDLILTVLSRIGGPMVQVRKAFAGLDAADPQAADRQHQTRYALKHALERERSCTHDEANRIAGILERATAEILGGQG